MVGLGLGEDPKVSFVLFNLSLLGCKSLWETLLQNFDKYVNMEVGRVLFDTIFFIKFGQHFCTSIQMIIFGSFLATLKENNIFFKNSKQ